MFKTSPWFSIVFTAVIIGNGFVPMAVASEWNSQNGFRGSEARSKNSLRYSGRYPMLLTQGGTNEQAASDLIPFLLDDSAEIREKAFNDLSQLGVGVAVPALTGALQNSDWQVRVISAYSLGRLGPEASSAVPALINSLEDGNVDVRFSAAQALGKINADQAVSPLINALKDPDENVRFAAASALLQLGKKVQYDNIRILNRFLKNGNPMPVYPKFAIVDTLKPESRLGLSNYAESLGASNWFLRNQSADILVKLKLGSIPPLSNTIWIGVEGNQSEISEPSSGFVRGVFTNTFLNTNFDGLIEILKTSKNTEIRQQAAQILEMLGNAEAIPYLIDSLQKETLNWIGAIKNEQKVLRDNPQNEEAMTEASSKASDSSDATQKIITSLGRLKSKESIPVILETWQKINAIQPDKDRIEDLRDCIQDSLEKIGSQEAISALSKTFPEDAKSFTASDSIRKITKGETNSQESIVLLKSILHSGNIDAISKVINPSELANNSSDYVSALKISFQQLGVEKSVSILKPILLADEATSDTYNRLAAAKYLSLLGAVVVPVIVKSFSEAEAIAIFTDVLNRTDKNTSTQELAKKVLKEVSSKVVPILINILRNTKSNDTDRKIAIGVLSDLSPKEAVPFLIKFLRSKNDSLKSSSIQALGEIGSVRAIPFLTARLNDEKETDANRWWSAISLGKIRSTAAIPYFIRVIQQDSEEQNRTYMITALGETQASPESVKILITSLQDKSYSVREAAAVSLGKLKTKVAIPSLIESLKDPTWTVRLAASTALKSIGTEAIPPLIKVLNSNRKNPLALQTALKDKNADHRLSAAYVLWDMGTLANSASSASSDLMTVVKNENDNLYVRWMSATALERMGNNMEQFFEMNNLINPKTLTPNDCPNDIYNPEFDNEATIAEAPSKIETNTHEIVYQGRCIYGDITPEGGPPGVWMKEFIDLLSNRIKRK